MTSSGLGNNQYTQLESREAYKTFYDEQGVKYGNNHLTAEFPRAKFILERLRPSDVVLEMGCQTGGITRLMAERVESVVANELSDTYRARAIEALVGLENVEVVDGFAEDLHDRAMFDEAFTVVVAMELLEHVADPDKLCESVNLCLMDGGRAFFSVPKCYIDTLGEHVREFTLESFRELLERHFYVHEIVDAGEWYLAEARV